MRRRPGQATATRYLTGAEQDRLDRQLTPETAEWRRDAVEQARRGLKELATFDRAPMTDAERVSADLMQWQLQIIVDGEPFSDYDFPLDQFGGANVGLPNLMTVIHPVRSATGRRQLPGAPAPVRRAHGRSDARRRATSAAKGILPPRFILRATIAQMQQFVALARRPEPAGRVVRRTIERRRRR